MFKILVALAVGCTLYLWAATSCLAYKKPAEPPTLAQAYIAFKVGPDVCMPIEKCSAVPTEKCSAPGSRYQAPHETDQGDFTPFLTRPCPCCQQAFATHP